MNNPNKMLEEALRYAEMGWKLVALHPHSKMPALGKGWPEKATDDPNVICEWIKQTPDMNLGLLLGGGSRIIDAECDSPEEEATYLDLWEGDPPVTCCYSSSELKLTSGKIFVRKHRFLKWRDDLPGGATIKIGKLIIRIGNDGLGTQSVVPPSIHPSGSVYTWLTPPEVCPPAEIPDHVVARMHNLAGSTFEEVKDVRGGKKKAAESWAKGSKEGERNSNMASYCGWLLGQAGDLKSRKSLRNLFETAQAVNANNHPPLAPSELKTIFSSILQRERTKRVSAEMDVILPDTPEEAVERAEEACRGTKKKPRQFGGFWLVIEDSEPPTFWLHSEKFTLSAKNRLQLTAEEMISPRKIRTQSLKQANYPLPANFDKAWNKMGGLCEQLVLLAVHVPAAEENVRSLVVAQRLMRGLLRPRILEDDEVLDDRGVPTVLPDGSIVFLFETFQNMISTEADKITRPELARLLKDLGAGWYQSQGIKFKKLEPAQLLRLKAIVGTYYEEAPSSSSV